MKFIAIISQNQKKVGYGPVVSSSAFASSHRIRLSPNKRPVSCHLHVCFGKQAKWTQSNDHNMAGFPFPAEKPLNPSNDETSVLLPASPSPQPVIRLGLTEGIGVVQIKRRKQEGTLGLLSRTLESRFKSFLSDF